MRSDRFNRPFAGTHAAGTVKRPLRRLLTVAPVGAAVAIALSTAACGSTEHVNNAKEPAASAAAAAPNYGTVLHGSLPAVGKAAAKGGRITMGQQAGQTPTDIFPMVDGSTCSTNTGALVSQLYLPLYYGPTGAQPKIDYTQGAAEAPKYTDHDKVVSIKIKPGLKWSDGKSVDANDVIFFLDLLKAGIKESPANWCQYAPGQLPDNVKSWTTKGKDTVVLKLKKSVNPNWFTANQLQDTNLGVYPMPSADWNVASAGGKHLNFKNPKNARKIFDYLHKQGASLATFGTDPLWKVVDGPFKLKDFSATNSSYDLVPNGRYGLSPKPKESEFSVETFTSQTAELNALESGSLDIGHLDAATQLGAIGTLTGKGYSVFGSPQFGWYGGIINFKDTADHFNDVIKQPYVREALEELINQPAIVKGVYHGWASPAYTPVPTAPFSPYVPRSALTSPYKYSPADAVKLLKAHGWDVVPNGQTTCKKAGTGKGACGAGIPAGTPFKFVWVNVPKSTAATGVLESEVFASEAKEAAGIDIELQTKTFNFLTANYNNQNPAAKKYVNDWAVNNFGGIGTDYYPTQYGIETPGGGLNMGSFNDPKANKLMDAAVSAPSQTAIVNEIKYLTKNYPVFYMPDEDWIMVVSNKVGSASANGFLQLTWQQNGAQFLYLNK